MRRARNKRARPARTHERKRDGTGAVPHATACFLRPWPARAHCFSRVGGRRARAGSAAVARQWALQRSRARPVRRLTLVADGAVLIEVPLAAARRAERHELGRRLVRVPPIVVGSEGRRPAGAADTRFGAVPQAVARLGAAAGGAAVWRVVGGDEPGEA
eukprot:893628-Prymnesium_polylepis.1